MEWLDGLGMLSLFWVYVVMVTVLLVGWSFTRRRREEEEDDVQRLSRDVDSLARNRGREFDR